MSVCKWNSTVRAWDLKWVPSGCVEIFMSNFSLGRRKSDSSQLVLRNPKEKVRRASLFKFVCINAQISKAPEGRGVTTTNKQTFSRNCKQPKLLILQMCTAYGTPLFVLDHEEARYYLSLTDQNNSTCRPSIIGNQWPLSSHQFKPKSTFSSVYRPINCVFFVTLHVKIVFYMVVYLWHDSCPSDARNLLFPLIRTTSNFRWFFQFCFCPTITH